MNRLNSKVMWLSIASGLVLVYNAIATQFGYPLVENEMINTVVNIIFGLIGTFGAINNPTNKTGI